MSCLTLWRAQSKVQETRGNSFDRSERFWPAPLAQALILAQVDEFRWSSDRAVVSGLLIRTEADLGKEKRHLRIWIIRSEQAYKIAPMIAQRTSNSRKRGPYPIHRLNARGVQENEVLPPEASIALVGSGASQASLV